MWLDLEKVQFLSRLLKLQIPLGGVSLFFDLEQFIPIKNHQFWCVQSSFFCMTFFVVCKFLMVTCLLLFLLCYRVNCGIENSCIEMYRGNKMVVEREGTGLQMNCGVGNICIEMYRGNKMVVEREGTGLQCELWDWKQLY